MKIIDTHAHIYSDQFTIDIETVLKQAKAAGVERIYMPNVDAASINAMLQLEKQYPGYVFPMMGLHPCSVGANFENDLQLVENWLEKRKFSAVGEIGIDLYWDKTYFEQQKMAFQHQLKLAIKYNLPAIIHCRDSFEETINLVEDINDGNLRGIFHCFSGTLEQANRVLQANFLLGIGGVATFKNGGLDKVLPFIPADKIVLETDSPYLAPVPNRGKRNDPSQLTYIISKVAALMDLPIETLAETTTTNAHRLFG